LDSQERSPGAISLGSSWKVPFAMAGKHLSLEEVAKRLGVSVEEVNRLVDRKELFPMRSGGTIKFKLDEVERIANNLGSPSSHANDDLSLDLDLSAPGMGSAPSASGGGGGESLIIGGNADDDDDSIFSTNASEVEKDEPRTVIKGAGSAPAVSSGAFDVDDLGLDSLVGGPMVTEGQSAPSNPSAEDDSAALSIDLAGIDGSLVGGSLAGTTAAGVSGVVDSGLSLEGSQIEASGIDLAQSIVSSGPGATGVDLLGASLAGDAFDLGADVSDEESASVVIPTEETGDSSFFEAATDDSASVSFDGSSEAVDFGDAAGVGFAGMDVVPASPPFSVWQVVGLILSSFLMVLIGLVVFDVLQTVRAPKGTPITAPVLNALTKAFGW
jgi:excisionase family DNA binding protein